MSEQKSINELFARNAEIRDAFVSVVSRIEDDLADRRVGGETWTIAEIVEHVSMVNASVYKVCGRLLRNAAPVQTNGPAQIDKAMIESAKRFSDLGSGKLEAPDIVKPTGTVPIRDSLSRMIEISSAMLELRELFETRVLDGRFPHPFFGELNAVDWLMLSGGHELRHLKQIERIIQKGAQ